MERRNMTRSALLLGGALLALAQGAGAVTISQVPLFIASGATPNVMLFIDNSGSMDNIIWASGYNPATTYTDWSPTVSGNKVWTSTDGNLYMSDLTSSSERGSCASGKTRGVSGSTTKCLKLPDPVGSGNTRYSGNYLNYLFQTYANNTDLSTGTIPSTTRMIAARNVSTNLVNNNASLRWGLSTFNSGTSSDSAPGGKILQSCGATTSSIVTSISGLTASTWTPLAEAYYEITRYFRGLSRYFNTGSTYVSPIQYRCQKNFVIVVTDGLPTYDNGLPTNDPDDTADTAHALPNWDGLAPSTTQSMYPNFPQYSDGFKSAGSQSDEGYTLYLDDLAKFGQDVDMKKTGTDTSGVSYQDSTFLKQNLVTYTVGFSTNNQMLIDAAQYGDGLNFTANDEAQLTAALQGALTDIAARISSAASVATNSTRLASNTLIYQAKFSTADWGGQLLAYPILANGSIGALAWDASTLLPAAGSRNILTYNPGASLGSRGAAFQWASLTSAQQTELNKNAAGTTDTNGQARLNYLRGDRSNESPSGLGFRPRSTVLGDIVNSDPLYVGQQDFGFEMLPGSEGTAYKTFRSGNTYKNRRPMVYVAANDGMLHGFDAETGVERVAYMPNAVYPQLRQLMASTYNSNHLLINDGAPKALDAYLGGAWKTVLIGSLGGGGRGVYTLDVTNPTSTGTSSVMWEFTSGNDTDLGYSIPQPTIVRLNNGKWGAIVANGYNSASAKAILFVIDLETGAVIRKFDTLVGSDNGLSSPTPVDVDGDRITDYVYAGDLKGNLWKFDLTSASASNWKIAFGTASVPAPLWTACTATCNGSNYQPITARPEVGINPPEGFFVYFGTGRYFAVGDNAAGGSVNTFYGIKDRNGKDTTSPVAPTGGRASLVQQSVISQETRDFDGNIENIRVTTNNPVASEKNGWYLDLPDSGERQVSTPILRGGHIVFTTIVPYGDVCSGGGSSWLMEIDALTGSRLGESPFDLNRDLEFDREDYAPITVDGQEVWVPVSGRQGTQGIMKTPGVIADCPEAGIECKDASGAAGGFDTTLENAGEQRGRQSWRQIQ